MRKVVKKTQGYFDSARAFLGKRGKYFVKKYIEFFSVTYLSGWYILQKDMNYI